MKFKIINRCFVIALLVSCNSLNKDLEENAVARVNDSYLYKDDIKKIIPQGASKADSTLIANSYINNWAGNLLLMKNAKLNLPDNQQQDFRTLVKQYETDLYTQTYLEALVKRSIDTTVTNDQAAKIYESNKESFKLNEALLKLRYISLPQNAVDLNEISQRFKDFNDEDKRYLNSISIQFKSFSLNDSIWIKTSQVIEKIPVVNEINKNQLLKKTNLVQLKDSLNLYLIQIKDVLSRGDYAPLDYVKPTVKQIVINKRKLELIKQIENEITKDAIKNKQFETYK